MHNLLNKICKKTVYMLPIKTSVTVLKKKKAKKTGTLHALLRRMKLTTLEKKISNFQKNILRNGWIP